MKFFLALLASQQTLAESGVDGSCVAEEVSLLQSHHRAAKENQTWVPDTGLHLSAPGAPMCLVGASVSKAKCYEAVRDLAPYLQPNLRGLQVGKGGTCGDGGWGQVPNGCSAQSGGDWAPHFKRSGGVWAPQPAKCVSSVYQLVCTVPQQWYLAPYGQATCTNGGVTISSFACDFAVHELAKAQNKPSNAPLAHNAYHGSCNGNGWGKVPTGCSARTGHAHYSDWRPHYRAVRPGLGDPKCASNWFQLVCTTPQ